MQRSIVSKTESGWDGVAREGYVPGAETAVVRHTIVGGRKAADGEPGPSNELRYFAVPSGACSRLEKHEHEHYVIVGEGVGYAIVGESVREVRQHDVVYVGPLEPHQFVNRGPEPFGFFCMVPANRDFSQEIGPDELSRLMASPAGAYLDPDGAPPPRALRLGLLEDRSVADVPSFDVHATRLGLKPGYSYDDVEELLDAAEGPMRR